MAAPVDGVLSEHDLVQPDIVMLLQGGAARVKDGRIHGAPDLVVEVLSPNTRERDLGLKRLAFHRAGIPAYWVVDPQTRTLTALRFATAGYETEAIVAADETFQPAAFPGLEVPVATLFSA